ncbi:aminoacetone oxidase family FAD-binding enzyme, partial [Staphylococcus pseudintermedius]
MPEMNEEAHRQRITKQLISQPEKQIKNALKGWIEKRYQTLIID